MPDDHSKLVPLLPIPNRTVKRLSADDSAGSRVKVGHRQALTEKNPVIERLRGFLFAECKSPEDRVIKKCSCLRWLCLALKVQIPANP